VRKGDLGEMAPCDETTLTRSLRPLRKSGWVTIRSSSNRRERLGTIAKTGKEKLEQARPSVLVEGPVTHAKQAHGRDVGFPLHNVAGSREGNIKTTIRSDLMSNQSHIGSERVQARPDKTRNDRAPGPDQVAAGHASRRDFLSISAGTLAAAAVGGSGFSLSAATGGGADEMDATMTVVSKDSATIAGEPLSYLATPNPEISSSIVTIPPATTTEWMTHPVQGYLYVLEGTLTVEYAGGSRKEFKTGHGFPQARSKWHRGRNDGDTPVRFLAVFFGGKDVPNVLHPPKSR
jgi:quercetin dioxygenase-like cupin family protein